MDYSPPGSSVHGFSRQEYWTGLSCPPPGDSPDLESEPKSPAAPGLQVDSSPLSHGKSPKLYTYKYIIVLILGFPGGSVIKNMSECVCVRVCV